MQSAIRCGAVRLSSLHATRSPLATVARYGSEWSAEYHRHSTRYHATDRDTIEKLEKLQRPTPFVPRTTSDRIARSIVRGLRAVSDIYFRRRFVERATMLETIAAVPGMVGAVMAHFLSLRTLRHDRWIKPSLDEAENERMHLMTFMEVWKPNFFQRAAIYGVQAGMIGAYSSMYLFFPRTAHRFVGYLEEEAVHTYSEFLKDIDAGIIPNGPAPSVAKSYWGLPEDATLRDAVVVIRADEIDHGMVNHHFSDLMDWSRGMHTTPREHFRVDITSKIVPYTSFDTTEELVAKDPPKTA